MEVFLRWLSIAIIATTFTSCKTFNLDISSVGYQSVRTTFAQPDIIPNDAKINTSLNFEWIRQNL